MDDYDDILNYLSYEQLNNYLDALEFAEDYIDNLWKDKNKQDE